MIKINECNVVRLNYTFVKPYEKWKWFGRFLRWFIGYDLKYYIQPILGISLVGEHKALKVNDYIILDNGDKFIVNWKSNSHALIKMIVKKETHVDMNAPIDVIYHVFPGTKLAILGSVFHEKSMRKLAK